MGPRAVSSSLISSLGAFFGGCVSGRFLLQTVDPESYAEFSDALYDSSGEFNLEISCHGGDTDVMWAFYDKIRCVDRVIIGTAWGYCHSAAPLILAACTRRRSSPLTEFMVHEDICRLKGMPDKVLKAAARAQLSEDKWYTAMQASTGTPAEKWRIMSVNETYFNPESAKNLGMIDEILKPLREPVPTKKKSRIPAL